MKQTEVGLKKKKEVDKNLHIIPMPIVIVSVGNFEDSNLITISYCVKVVSEPPVISISVRPHRHSMKYLVEGGYFGINIPTQKLLYEVDYCGTRSGKKVNKWNELNLIKFRGKYIDVPLIEECPINFECKTIKKIEIGSHIIFYGEVLAIHISEAYLREINTDKYKIQEGINGLIYFNRNYYSINQKNLGTHGFSVSSKRISELKRKKKQNK
ncbi:MAG: flavin reductase family protein [Promethearchaeota archaeon]